MPNRIIKESICTSDDYHSLTPFQRDMFIRLIVTVDDYGCFDARPAILKGTMFPLENCTTKAIEDSLNAMANIGMVILYAYNGKPYLCLQSWKNHQSIRNMKPKYPLPDDEGSSIMLKYDEINTCKQLKAIESNCKQMKSIESKCPRNPIQSESESESESNAGARDAFDAFWSAYPKKKDKENARKAFDKLKVDDALLETMLSAIEWQKQTDEWRKQNGDYVPYPSTWLNGRRWEDEKGKVVSSENFGSFDTDDFFEAALAKSYESQHTKEVKK